MFNGRNWFEYLEVFFINAPYVNIILVRISKAWLLKRNITLRGALTVILTDYHWSISQKTFLVDTVLEWNWKICVKWLQV